MSGHWGLSDRASDLARAECDGVDLLVVGGGITGAGVLRDAASRGLSALLVEREDFASGTSSRSSKFAHGGLRYIAEGQLGLTRESCRERDRLLELAPHLVKPVPFLFPAYEDSKVRLWQVRAALWIYAGLANFRATSRFKMLPPEQVSAYSRDLRSDGLRGAGFYWDGQVDDVRLVLETLKSARAMGCAAVNHAEVVEFLRDDTGRLTGARVHDALADRTLTLHARVVVNAAGPSVERVRGLDRRVERPELRPAKGVHLVIPRERIHIEATITFEAADGRNLFLTPWGDMALIGTTDSFSDEIDEPVATIDEVHYLLSAVNRAFPRVGLTTNDLCSTFAGVRPLADSRDRNVPSSVSREERIYRDDSGLLSAAGGKLTTYRATGERIVDLALRELPPERRRAAGPSRTARLPIRPATVEVAELESSLTAGFGIDGPRAAHLVRVHGEDAPRLLSSTPPELHRSIGCSISRKSRNLFQMWLR